MYLIYVCCVSLLLLSEAQSLDHEDSYDGSGDAESGEESGDNEEISKRNQISPGYAVIPLIRSINPTYPEILNASVRLFLTDTTDEAEIKDLLQKYYFTEKKAMSIWPKAIDETVKTLNSEFSERELFEMENDIKSIYRRMLECDLLVENKRKKKLSTKLRRRYAKCYLTLRDYIDDGFTDFGFPRGTIEGQAHILQMSLAYNVMSLLVLRMSQVIAEKANVQPMRAAKAIFDIADNLVTSVKTVTKDTIDARIQAISQIEICLMQDVLWQEFQVSCEFRMKRDVETAAGIGGPADKFQRKYRAKVTDEVTKKEVCNMALTTDATNDKDAIKAKLTKSCAKLRDSYARTVKKDIQDFYAKRTLLVVEELPKLWSSDRKKLDEIKASLRSKN